MRQRYFIGPPLASSLPEPVEFTRLHVVPAFSFGGGATVQVWRGLALGADVRSLHLLDDEAKPDRFIMPSGMLR